MPIPCFAIATTYTIAGRDHRPRSIAIRATDEAFLPFGNNPHSNFCAFAIFRRAAADIVCFRGRPFGAASPPASSQITSMALSSLLSSDVCVRVPLAGS
jgi:hypothetical protein